jgi:cyclopropane-fatty-acyl-phospholipid synthase
VERLFAESDNPRSKRVELEGWEQFNEPVDRIVSIGAFEHFGFDRYDDFFTMAYNAARRRGDAAAHHHRADLAGDGRPWMPLTFDVARFVKFILTEIFPAAGCRRWRRSRSIPPRPASR